MRYEINLENLPAGYAAESVDKGETLKVINKDFLTTENGQIFFKCLEGFESKFLRPFVQDGANKVSTIDHCLVLIDKNKKATVYINELDFIGKMIPKRDIQKGEPILKRDIAGIIELYFKDLSIPKDNGIAFYFSIGWRRGFFFDYRPLKSEIKLENIEKELAEIYQYLLFSELYSIKKEIWDEIYSLGWFPFISIIGGRFEKFVSGFTPKGFIKTFEDEIINYVNKDKLTELLEKWRKQNFLATHITVLEKGIERYFAKDYISSINNTWPRIEGILRYAYTKGNEKVGQSILLENMEDIVANKSISPSLFFPNEFRNYLLKFYFKDFSIKDEVLDVSRHSIGHGVSDVTKYDQKHALLGILIVDQLSYYLKFSQE